MRGLVCVLVVAAVAAQVARAAFGAADTVNCPIVLDPTTRTLVDCSNRERYFHGVNVVYKVRGRRMGRAGEESGSLEAGLWRGGRAGHAVAASDGVL
jgi:hypothetical protein